MVRIKLIRSYRHKSTVSKPTPTETSVPKLLPSNLLRFLHRHYIVLYHLLYPAASIIPCLPASSPYSDVPVFTSMLLLPTISISLPSCPTKCGYCHYPAIPIDCHEPIELYIPLNVLSVTFLSEQVFMFYRQESSRYSSLW